MVLKDLKVFAQEFQKKHPEHSDEVNGFVQLCMDEIDAGESEINEIDLCIESINQLLEEEED